MLYLYYRIAIYNHDGIFYSTRSYNIQIKTTNIETDQSA